MRQALLTWRTTVRGPGTAHHCEVTPIPEDPQAYVDDLAKRRLPLAAYIEIGDSDPGAVGGMGLFFHESSAANAPWTALARKAQGTKKAREHLTWQLNAVRHGHAEPVDPTLRALVATYRQARKTLEAAFAL